MAATTRHGGGGSSTNERTPLLSSNGGGGGHHHQRSSSPPHSDADPIHTRLSHPLDGSNCTIPLALQCYLSGFIDAVSFMFFKSTWVSFQTGNFATIGLYTVTILRAITVNSNLDEEERRHPSNDWPRVPREDVSSEMEKLRYSLLALLGFTLGSFLFSRTNLLPTWSKNSRGRYVFLALLQALSTLVVLVTILPWPPSSWRWFRPSENELQDPSSSDFTSSSFSPPPWLLIPLSLAMGAQSIASLQLPNHSFSTTVVFTSVLSQCAGTTGIFPWVLMSSRARRRRLQRNRRRISSTSSSPEAQGESQDEQQQEEEEEEEEKEMTKRVTKSRLQLLSLFLLVLGAATAALLTNVIYPLLLPSASPTVTIISDSTSIAIAGSRNRTDTPMDLQVLKRTVRQRLDSRSSLLFGLACLVVVQLLTAAAWWWGTRAPPSRVVKDRDEEEGGGQGGEGGGR